RLENGDLDAERADLPREDLGETADRPLGRLVGGQAGGGEPPADGRDLDDVAAALGAQHGQRGLGDVHDAEQVGVDLCAEVVERDVLDRREVGVAGIVDHDVDPAERLDACLHRGRGGCGVGDVEGDREDPVPVAVGQVGQADGVAGGRDQRVPGREHGLGDLAAKAPAAPGEKEDLRHVVLLHSDLTNHRFDNNT